MVTKRKITAIVMGIIITGAIIFFSGSLDTTRDIMYLQRDMPEDGMPVPHDTRTVYICNDPNLRLYHFYIDCDVLAGCTKEISEMKQHDAEAAEKVACSGCLP